jgi:molecular chaperone GrpE
MTEEKMNKTSEKKEEEAVEEQAAAGKGQGQGAENAPETKDEKDNKEAGKKEGKKKIGKDKKEEKIIELETKFNELSEKHLRLQAEFDNFRRRTLREKAELIKSGGESVLMGILPVIDDFERAIDSMEEIADDDAGKEGILLIYSKFKDFLRQNNVKEIEAFHQDFDVDHHEALTKIPAPDEKLKGKVVDVIQKGYTLNDKVIRFAKVVVGE